MFYWEEIRDIHQQMKNTESYQLKVKKDGFILRYINGIIIRGACCYYGLGLLLVFIQKGDPS